ncbi:DUF664 domain-containing protein [Isoptericola sp. b490]|uniref:mycothiol transferase n=1 Tax=Actinotalea lenta TaxID=3064654 RepID=UPI0027142DA6|nr:DUF664 domain-containing protein [Isoptericola sp. b490]MDO8119894.1 DUF664 domain-containing protein [Isoptericola sp. b490]
MDVAGLLADGYSRIAGSVHRVLQDVDDDLLSVEPEPGSNTIAWLVWHLTRVQDDHLADAFGRGQVWTSDGWVERFGLPLPAEDTGYGHGPGEVAAVRVGADLLVGYHDAVHARSAALLDTVDADALDRVVDTRWDPPVTLGVRLVSVLADDLQHVGQAAYLRGLLERRTGGQERGADD